MFATQRRSVRHLRAGFTLVELLMVVAIMGVLLGAASFAFNSVGDEARMRTASSNVRTYLNLARQWAITHRQDTYLNITSNKFVVESETLTGTNVIREAIGSPHFLPPGIVFSNLPATAIGFRPNGALVGSGASTQTKLYLRAAIGTNQTIITIYPLTGMTKITNN